MNGTITVNGETCSREAGTIAALLDTMGVDRNGRGVAVAVNDTVVPKGRWTETAIDDGDRVEVVRPFSGG